MKLTKAHIWNFKSVNDSGEFNIDDKVTCFVGKNESGKTALLQALTKINAAEAKDASLDLLEYPRFAVSEYKERQATSPDTAVTTSWRLDDAEAKELSGFLGETGAFREFTVSKLYNNELRFGFEAKEAIAVEAAIAQHGLTEEEARPLQGAQGGTVQAARKALAAIEEPAKRHKDLLEWLTKTFKEQSLQMFVEEFIKAKLPKMALFHEYVRMPGQLSLNELKAHLVTPAQLGDPERIFLALLDMVGRKPEDLEKTNKFEELQAELEGVSNRLSKEIFAYWSQNRHLQVQFRFEQALPGDPPPFNQGYVLRTRILNTRHGVSTSFDQRSAGFVWFFSFLVWFHQIKKQYGSNFVLLLDEPALSLHARAQGDLLRYFEERLATRYQLLYTTHSPFMVDPKNILRVRTVEDHWIEPKEGEDPPPEDQLGTKVGDEVLSTDRDTVFPLQGALGYEISQSLFVSEHTLLVEGPSDLLYLQHFAELLRQAGRISLDKRWVICPSGGLDKIGAFLSLFGGNRLHVAVLTDCEKGTKKKIGDLRKTSLLKEKHVLTVDVYAGQPEADIEDLVGRDNYTSLVNATYGLDAKTAATIPPPAEPARIVQFFEQHFRTLPPAVAEFDHYQPALYLLTNRSLKLPCLSTALDRFEALYKDLNGLLPSAGKPAT